MRRRSLAWHRCVCWIAVATGGAALHTAGCSVALDLDSCDYMKVECPPLSASDGGGGGGGTEPPPPECVPKEKSDGAVDDTCEGVFVSSSLPDASDNNDGTMAHPVRTLGKAIALAQSKKGIVYACAERFEERVVVQGGVSLFGGLDCKNGWTWIGETTQTTITAEQGVIPLTMDGAGGTVRIQDCHIEAAEIDPAKSGLSSIAAVASSAQVQMTRCKLEAKNAAPGADGEPLDPPKAPDGPPGKPGSEACGSSGTASVQGGESPLNDCETATDDSDDSVGGKGGDGQFSVGGPGAKGELGLTMNGGAGQPQLGSDPCTAGLKGDDGAAGTPGSPGVDLGRIAPDGYEGKRGLSGGRGKTAQGGGGGGGAKGALMMATDPPRTCPLDTRHTTTHGGASGGSGGAGGCGGKGGSGGGAGGASIALISIDSTLVFESVTITTGDGGKGGAGGPGQVGGQGGTGGLRGELPQNSNGEVTSTGLLPACAGGLGGEGGKGGGGGGGRGGHSIGIAFLRKPPPTEGVIFEHIGSPALGGIGADTDNDGAPGVGAPTQSFDP